MQDAITPYGALQYAYSTLTVQSFVCCNDNPACMSPTCCEPGYLSQDVNPFLSKCAIHAWFALPKLLHHLKEDLKQHNGSGIVEQGLSLHQHNNVV